MSLTVPPTSQSPPPPTLGDIRLTMKLAAVNRPIRAVNFMVNQARGPVGPGKRLYRGKCHVAVSPGWRR